MGEGGGERKRETVKERERERKREREGREREREKQMCQNCMPTMNVNTLCIINFQVINIFKNILA